MNAQMEYVKIHLCRGSKDAEIDNFEVAKAAILRK